MKNILYFFLLLLLPVLGFAQSRYGVEGVPMCWTISGKDSSIVRYVLISSTGKPVKTVAYENAQGAVINVSGGVLRYGFCDCAGGALDSLANASVTWAKLASPVKDSIRIGMNPKRDTNIYFTGNYNLGTAIDESIIQRRYRKINLSGMAAGSGTKVNLILPDGGSTMSDVDVTVFANEDTISVLSLVNDQIATKFKNVLPNKTNEYKCLIRSAGYSWRGSTWDSLGVGGGSGIQLNMPTLSITVISEVELSLSWTAVAGADKYILERSTSAGFTTAYVVYEGGLNYWINQGLLASTTYYYRVRAEAIGYVTSNNSTAVNATTQAAFNPNLSGQVVFWDITDTTTTRISGEISAINDQGSGNNDVTDLTPNRPNYFTTGGPQNYPYVRTTTAEPLGVTTFSEATTPLTVYAVVRLNDFASLGYTVFEYNTLPSPGQTNSNGVKVRLNSSNRIAVGARGYTQTGQGAYYGATVGAMYRKEWMVLKIVFKDNNSHWIEINDEPVQFPKDSTGGAALAITRFLFYNCDIAQVRGFNRLMTTDEDRKMKAYLTRHFGIVKPKVLGMHFGDSNTAGGGNTPRTYGVWTSIVQDNSPSVFYNFGISGTRVDNSFDILSLKYAKPEYADMYVTIQYGTNDAQQWAGDWENWKSLYKSIIQRFLDAGFKKEKIILLTFPYSSLTSYFGDRQPYPLAKIQEIAKEMGVSFFDWNSEMKKIGSDVKTEPGTDGIHPGTSGNLVAGRGVLNILRGSTEEGMVPPQMDSVARKAIVFPQYGSLVQDTTADALYVYTGTWKKVVTSIASGIQQVLTDGNTTNLTQKFQQAVSVLNDTLDISKDGLFFKPDSATYNYRIWESKSIKRQIATEGSWYEGIQRVNNLGQPNPNVFLHRGYNISPANARLLTDVPAFSETWASNTRTSGEATGVRRIEKYFTVFGRNGASYKPETWTWIATNPGILGLTHEIVSPLNYFSFPSNGNIFAGINKTTGVATFDLKSSVYTNSTGFSLSVDSVTNYVLMNFSNLPEMRYSGVSKMGFGSGNKIVFNDLNTTAYVSFSGGTTFLLPTQVQTGSVFASTGGTFGHGAAPIAFLDIGGGTTTTAPIRMINGVFRTTIQNGAIEYVSPEWYGSSNGIRRMFSRPFDGTGSPEGVITASVGATYINNSGGATTQYIKISGTGNTGWAVKYVTGSPLVLPAGTATASTAPFKFTLSGHTQLTTGEAGVLSPNTAGTSLLFTDVSAQNQRLLQIPQNISFNAAGGSKANVVYTGNGTSNSPSLNYYQNGVFTGTTDVNGDLVVAFPSAMPDVTYSMLPTVEGTTAYTLSVHTKATGAVYVRFFLAGVAVAPGTSVSVNYEARDY